MEEGTVQAMGGAKGRMGTKHRWMGAAQQADEGSGRAGDGLTLPEWEAFVGFVASVAEGVATTVDARVEALRYSMMLMSRPTRPELITSN